MQETQVQSLGWEDPLEKEMVTYSSILAWEIPWTEELGRIQSIGVAKELYTTEQLNKNNETFSKSLLLRKAIHRQLPEIRADYLLL